MFMPHHFKEEWTHRQAFVDLLVCLSVDKTVSAIILKLLITEFSFSHADMSWK